MAWIEDTSKITLSNEKDFNSKWLKNLKHTVVKYKLKEDDIAEAKLLIDTQISKHKERDFFLIIVGTLFTVSIKVLGDDILLVQLLFSQRFLLAMSAYLVI